MNYCWLLVCSSGDANGRWCSSEGGAPDAVVLSTATPDVGARANDVGGPGERLTPLFTIEFGTRF